MSLIILLMQLAVALAWKNLLVHSETLLAYTRDDFPSDFVFGAGTSAFQYEGALAEDGRTPSIWDYSIYEGQNTEVATPDIASDGYHKYKEDIELMSFTGLEGYRFSISWSRLLSSGRGAVNQKGLEYYNNVINELVKHGIQPHVSLHHLDLPQVLQDEYGGWLSPRIIDDFKGFANVCFREFGDRVFHWTTMAEPNINAIASFDNGEFPPHRCSYPFGYNCREGNSAVEPYAAAHNMLLAHAAVVKLYRTRYQPIQKGKIGINLYATWFSPLTNSIKDSMASKRAMDFTIGWFMSPLIFGDYPEIMRKNAGSRLPTFSEIESQEVRSAFDFIGINYYFASFVVDNSDHPKTGFRDANADMFVKFTGSKDEPPIDQFIPPGYIPNKPTGLLKMLKYLKDSYGNPPIYIQENGCGLGVKDVLNDTDRISFLSGYIGSTLEAIRNGSDVRGYSVWSFLDIFELLDGYKSSFGLYHVNFKDNERQRVPKLSAYWYSNFLKHGSVIKIEKTQGDQEEYHAMQ
ncbi:beta-glucosidase 22 [Dendrobium catenatum]|uniref:Beta-glucosidase 22 n=1 Tax=Dendrobium catenatum TaxID=906689 RepID=A0A2I0VJY9_9ASPA|nr:beta-glucosidase 22 [Dendrobium catenatum]PKU63730.1 Beta-glucosidase 22 [Dendrobium catenatum]